MPIANLARHGQYRVLPCLQATERVTRFAGNAGSENWPFWLDVEVGSFLTLNPKS